MEKTDLISTHPVLVRGVAGCLKEIFVDGYHADKVLERTFKRNKKWGSRDRRFLAETVYNMTRWWSLLCFFADELEPKSENDFLNIWAIYEIWKNKKDALPFLKASFDLTLDASKIQSQINRTPPQPWIKVAFPEWIFKKFEKEYSADAFDVLEGLNEAAPVCLRANTLKGKRDNLARVLRQENVETHPSTFSVDGLILNERQNVFITKAFKDGLFEVQDEASQLISPLLNPKPGERIADMCAGAGGKTLHLAALMQNKGSLLACDVSERKLTELKERARRGGVSNLRVQLIEGSKSIKRLAQTFDGVLIDAPCSGTGVIRRNPDSKWKISEEELERLKNIQAEILNTYSKLVKPGGRLVYATCSLLGEENQAQIDRFLSEHPEFEKNEASLVTRPDTNKTDGFFGQLLRRNKS